MARYARVKTRRAPERSAFCLFRIGRDKAKSRWFSKSKSVCAGWSGNVPRLCAIWTPQCGGIKGKLCFIKRESQLHSVFDLLYQQYSAERLRYQTTHSAVSGYLSENLLYDALKQALTEMSCPHLSIVCHYPLSKLIADSTLLDAEERAFVESPFSHVDFLIYNAITKQPLLPIEVDGWGFHGGNSIQQHRDALKDGLLAKYDLSPCRISTTDRVTVEVLKELLAKRGLVDELQRTRDRKE